MATSGMVLLGALALAPTGQAIVVCGDTQADVVPGGGVYVCAEYHALTTVDGCVKVYIDANGNNEYDATDPQFGPCV